MEYSCFSRDRHSNRSHRSLVDCARWRHACTDGAVARRAVCTGIIATHIPRMRHSLCLPPPLARPASEMLPTSRDVHPSALAPDSAPLPPLRAQDSRERDDLPAKNQHTYPSSPSSPSPTAPTSMPDVGRVVSSAAFASRPTFVDPGLRGGTRRHRHCRFPAVLHTPRMRHSSCAPSPRHYATA
ncbi:hypothetical protein C8J57DRAFT_471970 [Mycena rebaudengoi]|nr:hypothetical protein C8J57DRAFT_471970 [Mycena rebaudengoi]